MRKRIITTTKPICGFCGRKNDKVEQLWPEKQIFWKCGICYAKAFKKSAKQATTFDMWERHKSYRVEWLDL